MNKTTPFSFEDFLTYNLLDLSCPKKLLHSLVVPRPVALITTIGSNGVINAAPFSYFNLVCTKPAIVSIAIQKREGRHKDTARNILDTGNFTINICSPNLAKALTIAGSNAPSDISEVELANLDLIPAHKIASPRIANTLAQMECLLDHSIQVAEGQCLLILGRILKVHLHKKVVDSDGNLNIKKLNPIARLAGRSFAEITNFFDVEPNIS